MTPQEIVESNEKIAQFISLPKTDDGDYIYTDPWGNDTICDDENFTLAFDQSWDWLMPVLKKISSIANEEFFSDDYFEFEERFLGQLNPIFRTIGEVHEKTVEFIDWYNSKKEYQQPEEISFENWENLPKEVQKIIHSFDEETDTYQECERLLKELRPHGFTFEYGLDGEPFDLQKMDVQVLDSVGCGIDQIGFVYPMLKDGNFDFENLTHYTAVESEWIETLSEDDRNIFNDVATKNKPTP